MTRVIRTVDTIDYAADKSENPAQHEDVLVGWQGQWVRLDLSHANYSRLAGQLEGLLEVGDPVKAAAPAARPKTPTGQKSRAHGRRSADYYEGLIAWADQHNIRKRDGSNRPAYASLKPDRHDYPDWLIRDYDSYLETGELPDYAQAS